MFIHDSEVGKTHFGNRKMTSEDALRFLSGVHKIDPEMPLQQIMCLLVISEHQEGLSLTELSNKVGLRLATASRYVSELGKMNRRREEGLNLVESYENPMERRQKIIRITTKGRITLHNLLGE